jgi:regulation of enolase protein 1 (concanavalin A-like superfamily)
MGLQCGGSRRLFTLLSLVAISLIARLAPAQTTAVVNPTTVSFDASPDHSTVLADGRPAVDHYTLEIYTVGGTVPFQTTNIGKPTPTSVGAITYDFSGGVAGWPLPGGTYEARVSAVGPNGIGTSTPSNTFTFSTSCVYALSGTSASPPAAGGGTQVTVTTTSGCSWTAASNVAWVAVGPASGTGTGTVIATVAANTSTTPRTGTFTVAGQTFTINQAAAVVAAPAAPASPSPASGATAVPSTPVLAWTASGATSYGLAFGTSNPPPQVVTSQTAASYTPGTLSTGTTYYWRVTATNSGGSTTGPVWSFTTAAATTPPPPTPTLPSPWTNRDVGSVGRAGSASVSGSTFTVAGSGADIWGPADAFQFVSQPVTGSVEIAVRVTGVQNTNTYAKAGVMLRESSAANSAHVILDVRPGGGIEFMTRSAAGATTASLASTTQALPAWLKLSRVGNTVTASVSADGSSWKSVGSTSVTMSATGQVGLAVTSHDTTKSNTASFDNVKVTLGTTGLPTGWANQDIGSVGLSGSTSYAAGTFTVAGAGANVGGTADAFQFVSRSLSGDGVVAARVASLQNTNSYAKAGVMMRAGLAANSAMVILDVRPDGAVEFMKRSATGGTTTTLVTATQAMPAWLRLARVGSRVTASVSSDGTTWRRVGSTTVGFTSGAMGLAVTSHTTTQRSTAVFDNVQCR